MESYIRVEHDKRFFGGVYKGVGYFSFVKLIHVNSLGSVEAAFKATTGIEPIHIVRYSEDDLYNDKGELIKS
ncbi:hypothetical protein LCGC14_0220470 [marine sediment metagenome]|uniref:Uncharacterized protein n=1 Tax=marine sediment metagenome TaxID=412755 RepID=A0A0F9WXM1_9ZZZZ